MSLGDVTNTMQILLGSAYVNDFDFNNRSYRVYVQADQQFRSHPGDIERYSGADRRRPDDAAEQRRVGARGDARRRASTTTTCSARRRSTDRRRRATARGRRCTLMEQLSRPALPQGMSVRVVGAVARGDQGGQPVGGDLRARPAARLPDARGAAYESLTLPFIILLSVPLAILGALLAQWGRGLINDVYCQIGLVDADRSVGEERHPGRRVRGAAARARAVDRRRRGRGARASGCGRS